MTDEIMQPLPVGKWDLYMSVQRDLAHQLFQEVPVDPCEHHRSREDGMAHLWRDKMGVSVLCIPNPPIQVCPEHPDTEITTSGGRHSPRCPKAVCRYEGEGVTR